MATTAVRWTACDCILSIQQAPIFPTTVRRLASYLDAIPEICPTWKTLWTSYFFGSSATYSWTSRRSTV